MNVVIFSSCADLLELDMHNDKEDYDLVLPCTDDSDDIPTFNVQDIYTGTDSLRSDFDLSDEGVSDSVCVDVTQDCPIVRLPFILLSKITMQSKGTLRSYEGFKEKVYEKLPAYIREAVMYTNQLNSSMHEFLKIHNGECILNQRGLCKHEGDFRLMGDAELQIDRLSSKLTAFK